ncbi:MAG: hypothetical protein OXU20_05120 [Myxococcales bacterium]|nr:hypothetical protein [Myxococcales bacterium]
MASQLDCACAVNSTGWNSDSLVVLHAQAVDAGILQATWLTPAAHAPRCLIRALPVLRKQGGLRRLVGYGVLLRWAAFALANR